MKTTLLTACSIFLISNVVYADSVNTNAPAANWRRTSASEQSAYAERVASVACKPRKCVPDELKACMDEVVRPPAPKGVDSMTIGDLAVGCIAMLSK